MTQKWVTISDLHLNREGGTEFDPEKFIDRYDDTELGGIAYLGDAVSRPDLHEDINDTDRQWAEYLSEYHGFMQDLDEIAEELGLDVYIGTGNHDPDPATHPDKQEAIPTMQDVHEDTARAEFASELEPEDDEEEAEDPYGELDEVFEDFGYQREDSVEKLYTLEFLREDEEREDQTIRGYLLEQFDNLVDADLTVEGDGEHDIVFGTSFLGPEYDREEEQDGGLYEADDFEELAEQLHTEPFYESWKRNGGFFGTLGETFSSVADTVNEGASYLTEARDVLFGDPGEDDSGQDETDTEMEDEAEEFELPDDFTFEDIPYEEASADHRRLINKRAAVGSLVESVEGPAIVMDHGMPNLAEVDNGDLDLVNNEHKGSTLWTDQLSENAQKIGSFVGGHFHNKGRRSYMFDEDQTRLQDVVNPSGTYAELDFSEGQLEDYRWFRPDGAVSTQVVEEPAEVEPLWDQIGFDRDQVVEASESLGQGDDLAENYEEMFRAGERSSDEIQRRIQSLFRRAQF